MAGAYYEKLARINLTTGEIKIEKLDVAKFYMECICDESCGKCTSCRMPEILARITEGKGTLEDLEKLEETAT